MRKLDGLQMDKKRKPMIKIGFSIDIQTNLKEVDFLDVTLNLKMVLTRNLMTSCVISTPTQIIKQLPNSISERLSKNSSNQKNFNTAKVDIR